MIHPFVKSSLSIPTIVKHPARFVTCSSGNFTNVAITESGEVFAWGSNKHGRIGLGTSVFYSS